MIKNKLRLYREDDCMHLIQLFYDTVRSIDIGDYSQEKIDAWTSKALDYNTFSSIFSQNPTVIIEQSGVIIGFGSISTQGFIELLFVHSQWQRQGIGTAILNNMEKYAKGSGIKLITVHSSITAKQFFLQRGYQVRKQQEVKINKETLTNFLMEKTLNK